MLFECISILVDIGEDTILLEYHSQHILPFHAVISKYMQHILNFQMAESSYEILPNSNISNVNKY